MEIIASIILGLIIAWVILMLTPAQRKVSYFTLDPWPIEMDNSNLALIGVGLASPKPTSSVMDASPASSAMPVMMSPAAPGPSHMAMAPGPSPVSMMAPAPSHMAMAPGPSPMAMAPVTLSPAPAPSS